jgi:anti-anti-sigma factor
MTDVPELAIAVLETGTTVRVRVEGSLDASTVPAFVGAVEPLTEEARAVTIDCGALEFCDSSGLGGFVSMRNAVGSDGTFVLENPSPGLRQILRITGLTDLLAPD